jgi:hypothetical protein
MPKLAGGVSSKNDGYGNPETGPSASHSSVKVQVGILLARSRDYTSTSKYHFKLDDVVDSKPVCTSEPVIPPLPAPGH